MFSCAAFLDVAIGITHDAIGIAHDAIGIMHDAIGITHDAIGITYDAITDDVLKSRSSDSLFQLPTCVRMHVHNLVRPGQPIQEFCCRFYPNTNLQALLHQMQPLLWLYIGADLWVYGYVGLLGRAWNTLY